MQQESRGRIILVRHGETDANRERCFATSNDIPLNEAGREQAQELARRLAANFHPQRLFSSEFLRARQTCEIISRALSLEAGTIEGIHERDFGCLKGFRYERMGELMSGDPLYDADRSWMWTPPEGESLDAVRTRAMEVLDAVRAKYPAEEIVVVCHGAVIQAICAHVTGEWSEAFVPPNCGIVIIEYEANGWKKALNSI